MTICSRDYLSCGHEAAAKSPGNQFGREDACVLDPT